MSSINDIASTIESHSIALDIHKYYDKLNERKDFQKLVREVAEEYILGKTIEEELPIELEEHRQAVDNGEFNEEEQNENYSRLLAKAKKLIEKTYISDGIVLKYKKRTNWHWKDEFDDELEAIGCLHLAKKITSFEENRYDIAEFALPAKPSLRVTNKSKLSKTQKEQKKIKDAELRKQEKDILQKKSLEELVLLFKRNKTEIDKLEKTYKADREILLATMEKEKVEVAMADEEGLFTVKMTELSGGYNTEELFFSTIDKRFFFLFALTENGEVYCEDLYAATSFTFSKQIDHEGHAITFSNGILSVDGVPLHTPPLDELKGLKKKDITYIEENLLTPAIGTVEVDGPDFFKSCKTASTQVEKLIDDGKLHPNVLKDFREIQSLDDITVHFEMIEDDTRALRSSIFRQKNNRRSQQLRRTKERAEAVLETLNN